jgi:hypothetical protein
MLGIWRFYRDGDAGWKWQRLSINKVVMAESRVTFADYAECVRDATQKGYQSQPSQEKLRPTFAPRSYNRPYVAPAGPSAVGSVAAFTDALPARPPSH